MINLQMLGQLLSDAELRERVGVLLSNKVKADVQSLQASTELSRRLLSASGLGGSGEDSELTQLRTVIQEHLTYYETLVDLSLTFNQRLIDGLQSGSTAGTRKTERQTPTMLLTVTPQSTVKAKFSLENNKTTPVSTQFVISPFASEDGSELIASRSTFSPASIELAPAQEARVELTLPITAEFRAGTTYLATITASGLDASRILVKVVVAEPAPRATVEPRTKKAPKRAAPRKVRRSVPKNRRKAKK